MVRPVQVLAVSSVLWLAAACGTGGATTGTVSGSGDVSGDVFGGGGDASVAVDGVGSGDVAIHPGDGASEVSDVSPDAGQPVPFGGAGAPCADPEDCPDGDCVLAPGGLACTAPCASDADCPAGWTCGGPKGEGACAPVYPELCRPCVDDADCEDGGAAGVGRCATLDPEVGWACTYACSGDDECPEGFACRQDDRGTSCWPAEGNACPCWPAWEGTQGRCQRAGEAGTCEGVVECAAGTLTSCDAPNPAAEACNGLDDDCDGTTDEGYADADGDGQADCVDEDLDGDGVANGDDNCPKVPNAEQADADGDGKGDACDDDLDGDNVPNDLDNCKDAPNQGQADTDGDGVGDACDDDIDGDGTPNAQDCQPSNADVFPGAQEVCDGIDNDCDSQTDPQDSLGCLTFYRDGDHDGFGDTSSEPACLCGPQEPFTATTATDCNDGSPGVHEGAVEMCNGLDDNCDGTTDEAGALGCQTYYRDEDHDGYGQTGDSQCLCEAVEPYTATLPGDCDDANDAIYPGASEICDETDNNCNGQVDEGAKVTYYLDADHDGYGSAASTTACSLPEGYAEEPGDCNDFDGSIHPGAAELCNGIDDDCDGVTDNPWPDLGGPCDGPDSDLCANGVWVCSADGTTIVCGAETVTDLTESCNGLDDDCDGATDENWGQLGKPCDGPDEDQCANGVFICSPDGQYAICGPEEPANIVEVCNGLDDDCDGMTDEGCL